jgi:hypothetical protein
MAAHLRDDILHGKDHADTHASDNRWRHQESGSYARHAAPGHAAPRQADVWEGGSRDLVDFLNKTRVEPPVSPGVAKSTPIVVPGNVHNGSAILQNPQTQHDVVAGADSARSSNGTMEVKCGPLLNYRRMENETWFGSVLIVTRGGGLETSPTVPVLRWRAIDRAQTVEFGSREQVPINGSNGAPHEPYGVVNGIDYTNGHQSVVPQPANNSGLANGLPASGNASEEVMVQGTRLYSDPNNTFWRFDLKIPMRQSEIKCEYNIPGLTFAGGKKTDKQSFFIPAISESMRIMFHSCNGFSVGTDEEAFSGPCLWNDVLRVHQQTPFHVMYRFPGI